MLRAVHIGRVDPATMHWGYQLERKPVDAPVLLREAREGRGLAAMLDSLQPPFAHYARARTTLAAYKALAAQGEPPPIPELGKGPGIKPAGIWAGVPSLAARLRVLGDLPADAAEAAGQSTSYSGALVDAVKRFQDRHGLEDDGVIGAGTLKALNVTLAQRVQQIELAMERMRWLPKLDDRPNVFVNVPLFRLWATDPVRGEEPLRMNVVVGQSMNHKTPLFVEQMEYVIFRPYWNPPRGITVKEIIPHAAARPVVLRLASKSRSWRAARTTPGVASDAGEPVGGGGGQAVRSARSRGRRTRWASPSSSSRTPRTSTCTARPRSNCSRARAATSATDAFASRNRPRFGEWVLRDYPEWTRARIDAAMQASRPTRVNLKQPLTVVLFYDTVHVNSENLVIFAEDIYGHDRTLSAALEQGYPYLTKG